MEWVKKNGALIVAIAAFISAPISMLIGVNFIVKQDPNVTKPEIHIIIPGGGDEVVQGVVGAPGDSFKVGFTRIRVRAATALAEEQGWEGVRGWVKAFSACCKVTDQQIIGCAIKAGFQPPAGELGDGSILKNLFEWLSNPENQAKIKELIKFFMSLALLFAQTNPIDPPAFASLPQEEVKPAAIISVFNPPPTKR